MPDKPATLNRFPLFGLFAYRAALKMKYPEEIAKLFGYSTAVLYAIFKAKAQKQSESVENQMARERRTKGIVKLPQRRTYWRGGW
jgi:hypothetical protein